LPKDVDGIWSLEQLSFVVPWAYSDFEREIGENILASYMIAETKDLLIGYAGLWVVLDEGHITNIAVHPEWRGAGVATMLITELLKTARGKGANRFTLEVRVNNEPAISLYKKFGFRVEGYRKKYYKDTGEDAAIMWLYDAEPAED
jgi:ribosomal-protein-alanine N-acetyltransferase